MGLFARRQEDDTVRVLPSAGPPGGATLLPARFEVVSVCPGGSADEASMTGVVWSDVDPRVGQLVVQMGPSRWPAPGRELPALVDPALPGRFAVTWAVVAVVAGSERTITATQWDDPDRGWDPGPDGGHERALAGWLTEHGHRPDDSDLARALGPALEARLGPWGWGR